MLIKNELRPVEVSDKGKTIKGYFHRFVFKQANYQTETLVLVELDDGKLRYYDPFFVQFSDRKKNNAVRKEENVKDKDY